jgi:hypothetical protein
MCKWKALINGLFRQREQSDPRSLISHPVSALVHIRSEKQGIGVSDWGAGLPGEKGWKCTSQP